MIQLPISKTTRAATTNVVLDLCQTEIISTFWVPKTVISDNSTCFTATAVIRMIVKLDIQSKTVLSYSSMSNGKAEMMVGTIKKSMYRVPQDG